MPAGIQRLSRQIVSRALITIRSAFVRGKPQRESAQVPLGGAQDPDGFRDYVDADAVARQNGDAKRRFFWHGVRFPGDEAYLLRVRAAGVFLSWDRIPI